MQTCNYVFSKYDVKLQIFVQAVGMINYAQTVKLLFIQTIKHPYSEANIKHDNPLKQVTKLAIHAKETQLLIFSSSNIIIWRNDE